MTPLARRHAAIEATMTRYRDRPFKWGSVDCAKVAAFHLKTLGYPILVSKAGPYRTALSARRALQKLGHDNLADVISGLGLVEIPFSRMLLGDLAELEGDSPTGTIAIYAGNGNLFGFHEDHEGLVTLQPNKIIRAWSVL